MTTLKRRKKAGENEAIVSSLLKNKVSEIQLLGKKRYSSDNVEISIDESFTHKNITYLVEIDSGNMAKLLVGQYVLLNQLCKIQRDNAYFLVIHTYIDKKNPIRHRPYNPSRTTDNLQFVNEGIYHNEGLAFQAIHLNTLEGWAGGSIEDFLGLFTRPNKSLKPTR